MNEYPDAGELTTALEEELRQISAHAPAEIRMRLLVAAHCAALVKRELATKTQRSQLNMPDADRAGLVGEIIRGEHDAELAGLRASVKDEVRQRLGMANPGYAQD